MNSDGFPTDSKIRLCHGKCTCPTTVMTESETDQNHQVVFGGHMHSITDSSAPVTGEMGSIVPVRTHPYRRRSADSNALSSIYEDAQSTCSYENDPSQSAPPATQRPNQMEICDGDENNDGSMVPIHPHKKGESKGIMNNQTVIQTMNNTYNQGTDAERAVRDLQSSTEQRLKQADAQITGTMTAIQMTAENRIKGIESQLAAMQQHQQAMMGQIDSKLSGTLAEIQGINESRLQQNDSHLASMNHQCQSLQATVSTLMDSLKTAMERLDIEHNRHDSLIQQNNDTVARVIEQSQVLFERNRTLEENETNRMSVRPMEQELIPNQTQQEMRKLRERNRDRAGTKIEPIPDGYGVTNYQTTKQETVGNHPSSSSTALFMDPTLPGKVTVTEPITNQRRESNPRNIDPRPSENPLPTRGTIEGANSPADQHVQDPGRITSDSHGYNPIPNHFYPNMMVDSCPQFTPATFQNWKREVKLWIAGQPGATVTQILAKLIHVLPLSVKTDALLYMESTENQIESRSVDKIMQLLDQRFGRTDSERACSWLTAFTEFKRENHENYKDFWGRFNRCTAKLAALGMPMTQQVIFNRAIQALRVPEGQLPIVLSALETRPDRFSIEGLRDITIRMYETHRPKPDPTEVFAADVNHGQSTVNHTCDGIEAEGYGQEEEDSWDDSMTVTMEDGSIFLMKPKKPSKPRNAPGMHESAKRGAIQTFRNIPNQKGKGNSAGKGVCIRCGDPSHHWKECPHPFREKLDERFAGRGGKGKGKGTYWIANENAPAGNTDESLTPQPDASDPGPLATPNDSNDEAIQPRSSPSINDVWAQYYSQFHDSTEMIGMCTEANDLLKCESTVEIWHTNVGPPFPDLPPILIDSGASSSVVGMKWIQSWRGFKTPILEKNHKEFHFGDGPACPSKGECGIKLVIPKRFVSTKKDCVMIIQVDIVDAVVPMLIAQTALSNMKGKLDFDKYRLELPSGISIMLIKSPSGHVLLPAYPLNESPTWAVSLNKGLAFPVQQRTNEETRTLTDAQLRKIHLQLGHCSPQQLTELVKFGKYKVPQEQIERIHRQCGCKRSVHRITPPVVSSWIARFSGEIVAMDIIYPFTEFGIDQNWTEARARAKSPPALLVVDSLTRFITCTLLDDVTTQTVSQAFLRDWVMHFGKPKRIILDQGGPGFTGHEWENLSHVFGWQYIKAPTRASHQNGLAERSVRSLKAAIQSIALNDGHANLTQEVITLAVIAKNHAPHAVTGLPPAFAMTGRCDITSGASTCIWEHDPLSHDSLIPQVNSLRKILDARNAILRADSENAIKLCLSHNLPDGQGTFFPIGSSVQIAIDKQWIGTFRVIAHSAGNLLIERGNKILKWPRCKTRLVNLENNDQMDNIHLPRRRNLKDGWRMREIPDDSEVIDRELTDEELEIPDSIDVTDQPINEEELQREFKELEDSKDIKNLEELEHATDMDSTPSHKSRPVMLMLEDSWDIGMTNDSLGPGHVWPEQSYVCHGAITCEDYAATPTDSLLDRTFCTYYRMDSLPGQGNIFMENAKRLLNHPSLPTKPRQTCVKKEEYNDDDVMQHFDPSRIPPRIAFKLIPAREAIEKEINDLIHAKPGEPPAMVEVALNDPRFRNVPRVQSTLVVKRKSVNQYKGRLCVRGDTIPLNTTAFISSPTVHRSGVKVICAIAAQMLWTIHSIDISQAFLQSSNLNHKDRVIVLPPNMIQMPWKGKLPPIHTDVNNLPRHTHGFLLIRPLYGGRDAPMRWFIALSDRLRQYGFKQLKTDVCMFNKLDSHGRLAGFLIAHVDDLLFCGTESFRKEAIAAIQTFRTGDIETLKPDHPIIFTGLLLEVNHQGKINLSQEHYINELQLMDINLYVDSTSIRNPALLKSTFKQGLGSLIWLHQTRPDIGFTITQIATQIVEACESATKARTLAALYNKIVKFAKNHPRKIVYARRPGMDSNIDPLEDLKNWKLIVFTDAGFGTLTQNHSVESHVVILGDVLSRDGIIQCHGMLLDHRCAKIHRVCRSTLAAEAHAAVSAVDVALWTQVLLTEIFSGKYEYARLTPPTEFPIQDPFRPAPTNEEVQAETKNHYMTSLATMFHTLNPLLQPTTQFFQSHCHNCNHTCQISTFCFDEIEKFDTFLAEAIKSHAPILFHPMILTDCCSLYSSMLRLQPKTAERCTRIALGFLRDSMKLIAFSFIDAGVNLGDVGTKHAGSLGILDSFLSTGRFTLSFVGRKQRREMKAHDVR